MADPSTISVVIPAYNEAAVIGSVVTALRRRGGAGMKSSSSTTARRDGTATAAAAAGARVVSHPYNKGNGAAVKTRDSRRDAASGSDRRR